MSKWTKIGVWLAGIVGTVIASVLTWWLTEGLYRQQPSSPPTEPISQLPRSSEPSSLSNAEKRGQRISGTAAEGPSINLNGQWRFISESPYGIVDEYWKLTWNNGTLSIDARRQRNFQYTWVPLNILQQQIFSNNVQFTIKDGAYSTTSYDLAIKSDDRIEGTYTTIDTFIKDMGGASADALISVPTDFGSPQKYSGAARLIREW